MMRRPCSAILRTTGSASEFRRLANRPHARLNLGDLVNRGQFAVLEFARNRQLAVAALHDHSPTSDRPPGILHREVLSQDLKAVETILKIFLGQGEPRTERLPRFVLALSLGAAFLRTPRPGISLPGGCVGGWQRNEIVFHHRKLREPEARARAFLASASGSHSIVASHFHAGVFSFVSPGAYCRSKAPNW